MTSLMRTLEFRSRRIVSGDGAYLITEDGTRLLDFYADTGASGLGYNHPAARKAFSDILERNYPVHSINMYPFAEREDVATRLCVVTEMDKAFFCNSGAEAIEACIKLARKHQSRWADTTASLATGRPLVRHEIWSLRRGFHGRTYSTLAAGDGPPYHMEGFGPHLEGFHKWDWDNIEAINPKAAAVLLSPVLGHHDVVPYTCQQLQSIRDYCDEYGILLIFDEVQSGGGRSGSFLYAQQVGVMPDIVGLAKGVAMGFPVGVCLARGEVADAFTPGSHFSTFGGSPPSCVFLNAMLDYLTPEFLKSVTERGEYTVRRMQELGWFTEVRGMGLLICGDSNLDAIEFAKRADEKNLIIGAWRKNPIRVSPVLDASIEDIERGIQIMDEVAREMIAEQS